MVEGHRTGPVPGEALAEDGVGGSVSAGLEAPSLPVPKETGEQDAAATQAPVQHPTWSTFTVRGVSYAFGHLVDFEFTCKDSDGADCLVLVTFTDHVFTRDPVPGDSNADAFPNCSRTPYGLVCPVRHRMSLRLRDIIEQVAGRKVWSLYAGDRYAQVPVLDDEGAEVLYAVIFSLDPFKGTKHHLRMLVRSAYVCDVEPPDTYGEVKFSNLVKLRMTNKHPRKVTDRGRKKPKMPRTGG